MTNGNSRLPIGTSGLGVLDVSINAARTAGKIVKERFLTEKEINYKGWANVVTDVDLESEKIIVDILNTNFPGFSILAEESEPITNDSDYTWVVDPIDGTRNFAGGIPHFCIVVALAKGSEIVAGVTYDPIRDELFTAEQGQGAYLNETRLQITEQTNVLESLMGFDMGYVGEKATLALDLIRNIWPNMQGIRLMGSSALGLAYSAASRLDIYFHHSLSPWDIASGLLIVKEAGGIVTDKQGNPADLYTPSIIASNPLVVADFLNITDGLAWRND